MQSKKHFASTLPSSGNQHVTTADFHQRIERRRQEQATLADMGQYRAADSLLRAMAESEKRVDNLRRVKNIQSHQQAAFADALFDAEIHRRNEQQIHNSENEALAKAMHQMSIEESAKVLVNKRICDESPELRELKHALAAASTNKVRQTQLMEKASIREQEQQREQMIAQKMERDRLEALQVMCEQTAEQAERDMQGRMALQSQMQERLERKRAALEQGLREKAAVDKIVREIEEEDASRMRAARQRQVELQRGIQEYLRERAEWRRRERARAEAELAEVLRYQAQQEERMRENDAKKSAKNAQFDVGFQKLCRDMEERKRAQEEIEQLLMELNAEEAEQRALEEIRKRDEKVAQLRADMIAANEQQKRLKAQREAELAREDAQFREQMMTKFAEDRRTEQMNAQRRRMEMERYRREVDAAVQERRAMREAELVAELAALDRERQREAERLRVVEVERQRLLREHADMLGKSGVPRGILQTPEDYMTLFGEAPPVREPSYGIKKREYVDEDQFR